MSLVLGAVDMTLGFLSICGFCPSDATIQFVSLSADASPGLNAASLVLKALSPQRAGYHPGSGDIISTF